MVKVEYPVYDQTFKHNIDNDKLDYGATRRTTFVQHAIGLNPIVAINDSKNASDPEDLGG